MKVAHLNSKHLIENTKDDFNKLVALQKRNLKTVYSRIRNQAVVFDITFTGQIA
jgi:hypothetical protein